MSLFRDTGKVRYDERECFQKGRLAISQLPGPSESRKPSLINSTRCLGVPMPNSDFLCDHRTGREFAEPSGCIQLRLRVEAHKLHPHKTKLHHTMFSCRLASRHDYIREVCELVDLSSSRVQLRRLFGPANLPDVVQTLGLWSIREP